MKNKDAINQEIQSNINAMNPKQLLDALPFAVNTVEEGNVEDKTENKTEENKTLSMQPRQDEKSLPAMPPPSLPQFVLGSSIFSDEVAIYILSFCDIEMLRQLALVCRSLKRLSNDESVWKRYLDFSNYEMVIYDLRKNYSFAYIYLKFPLLRLPEFIPKLSLPKYARQAMSYTNLPGLYAVPHAAFLNLLDGFYGTFRLIEFIKLSSRRGQRELVVNLFNVYLNLGNVDLLINMSITMLQSNSYKPRYKFSRRDVFYFLAVFNSQFTMLQEKNLIFAINSQLKYLRQIDNKDIHRHPFQELARQILGFRQLLTGQYFDKHLQVVLVGEALKLFVQPSLLQYDYGLYSLAEYLQAINASFNTAELPQNTQGNEDDDHIRNSLRMKFQADTVNAIKRHGFKWVCDFFETMKKCLNPGLMKFVNQLIEAAHKHGFEGASDFVKYFCCLPDGLVKRKVPEKMIELIHLHGFKYSDFVLKEIVSFYTSYQLCTPCQDDIKFKYMNIVFSVIKTWGFAGTTLIFKLVDGIIGNPDLLEDRHEMIQVISDLVHKYGFRTACYFLIRIVNVINKTPLSLQEINEDLPEHQKIIKNEELDADIETYVLAFTRSLNNIRTALPTRFSRVIKVLALTHKLGFAGAIEVMGIIQTMLLPVFPVFKGQDQDIYVNINLINAEYIGLEAAAAFMNYLKMAAFYRDTDINDRLREDLEAKEKLLYMDTFLKIQVLFSKLYSSYLQNKDCIANIHLALDNFYAELAPIVTKLMDLNLDLDQENNNSTDDSISSGSTSGSRSRSSSTSSVSSRSTEYSHTEASSVESYSSSINHSDDESQSSSKLIPVAVTNEYDSDDEKSSLMRNARNVFLFRPERNEKGKQVLPDLEMQVMNAEADAEPDPALSTANSPW